MRRKSILSILAAAAVIGVMWFVDEGFRTMVIEYWQSLGLLLVLAALVTLQVILVRRHLFTLPGGRTEMARPTVVSGTPRSAPAAGAETAAAAAAAPSPAAEDGQPAPALDSNLFSRFRQHLERMEEGGAVPQARRPAPPAPASEEEVQDRVELSSASRNKTGKAQPPPPAREEPEEEGPDLFADLRPTPQPSPQVEGEDAAAESAAEPAADAPPRPEEEAAAADAANAPPPGAPSEAEDMTPARPTPAAGESSGELADEAATLLKLAEEAALREDWDALRAGLDNYLAHLGEAPALIDWRARRLQVRLAVNDRDTGRALQGFEDMLAAGYQPTSGDVPALLEELMAGGDSDAMAKLRVSMLVRILAVFRQARDAPAMDRAYGWIEEAQEQAGDEQRLLQYLKNHLEIRKALGNVPGQLELIDQIGNRCYKLGLTDEAKAYYEMGLRLRGQEGNTEDSGNAGGESVN